jgi:hypothetical protein
MSSKEEIRAERDMWYRSAEGSRERLCIPAQGRLAVLNSKLGKPKIDLQLSLNGEFMTIRADSFERPDFWAEARVPIEDIRKLLAACGETDSDEGRAGEESKMET